MDKFHFNNKIQILCHVILIDQDQIIVSDLHDTTHTKYQSREIFR